MELQQLRYFSALCDYPNFTTAAASLFITQQALSRSIRNLESELGVKLFFRKSNGLELTCYGTDYLKCVKEMLHKLDEDTLLLKIKSAEKPIPVRMGFSYGIMQFAHKVRRRFSDEYPTAKITIEELTDQQCERLVCEHKLDVAFVTGPVDQVRFNSLQVMDCMLYAVMSADHPLARLHHLDPRDFEGQWIYDGGEEFNIHNEIVRYCEQWKVRLQFKAYSLDKLMFLHIVAGGRDILMLPQRECEELQSAGDKIVAVPFTEGKIRWTVHAITLREDSLSSVIDGFLRRMQLTGSANGASESATQSERTGVIH